jgi:outer membrane protein OmpA-like peptidoglycan-associated protein
VLTRSFHVPPENLVTQGYGERFLKVKTAGPSAANRRVAVRRITALITPTR